MQLKIVSFNLRCLYKGDGIYAFVNRAGWITETILAELPDVIGFQEATPENTAFLKRALPEYTFFYNGRYADFGGEGLLLALRNETVSLVTLDCFWLSETPYVPASRYAHQSDCPRVCQTALVRSLETGSVFRVSNNHLDHVDDEARLLGIRQVLAYLSEQQQRFVCPLFVIGDFNATPDSSVLDYCRTCESLPMTDLTADSGVTYHGFGKAKQPGKIDYILTDRQTAKKPSALTRWDGDLNGMYLSDHYPICVSIDL